MANLDVEHESINRFYVWWRSIPFKLKIQNGRKNDVICKKTDNLYTLLAFNMSFVDSLSQGTQF